MDFDLSKENIQPLRGGRNITQLGMALQAQTSRELQTQLLQQKEEFENAILRYEGNDPLENWYRYISWVEQSYPKQGHEGNVVPLLERCLAKFENDKRYVNDRRFCKLWIKFIDLQQNPIELYQMMYSRGLCRGCADLYRAWSYYHEAVGDFQNAYAVFEYAKKAGAQPYEDLEEAECNLFRAAGQHALLGDVDHQSLLEKRQALTTLLTYKPGHVGSVRTATGNAVVFPSRAPQQQGSRNNIEIAVYEDHGEELQGAMAAPSSILSVAKRQDAPKENLLKPGPWTTVPVKKRHATGSKIPTFAVHEDSDDLVIRGGIRLPENYPKESLEDFSTWKVDLTIPEPQLDTMKHMYPKAKVYSQPDTEFSLEELRAVRYQVKTENINVNENIRQDIIFEEHSHHTIDNNIGQISNPIIQDQHSHFSYYNSSHPQQQLIVNNCDHLNTPQIQHPQHVPPKNVPFIYQSPQPFGMPVSPYIAQHQSSSNEQQPINKTTSLYQNQTNSGTPFVSTSSDVRFPPSTSFQTDGSLACPSVVQSTFVSQVSPLRVHTFQPEIQQAVLQSPIFVYNDPKTGQLSPGMDSGWEQAEQQRQPFLPVVDEKLSVQDSQYDIWSSPVDSLQPSVKIGPKKDMTKFMIYEQSNLSPQDQMQPKGSAMKTPFKVLSTDDLAETGSRGGMDVAAVVQPLEGGARLCDDLPPCEEAANYTMPSDTQMFNINLNIMKVSTPRQKIMDDASPPVDEQRVNWTRKQLFSEGEFERPVLSTIMEETKSYGSSSNSSKSSLSTGKSHQPTAAHHTGGRPVVPSAMDVISEEHHSYLAENLMANAALRSSLLGDLMDLGPATPALAQPMQASPVPSLPSSPVRRVPPPTVARPLEETPSDPFRPVVIRKLLERVSFPGVHVSGYLQCSIIYKPKVSKDVMRIMNNSYSVDKQLGKGTFGTVFRAVDLRAGTPVALKYQKPANCWEFYICRELQSRLAEHPLVDRFMDISIGYFSDQASLLVSEYMPCGSLLDLVNTVKQKGGKPLKESLCIYFTIDMLRIVEAMHQAKIIHADIKPDNFLIRLSQGDLQPVTLQLIDFGCSIDMSLFPPGAAFTRKVNTEDFICCEMRDGRPWNYHTDLFCVAATTHVLLFDKYILLQKREGRWSITQRLARYMKQDLWYKFFNCLLNQQDGPADNRALQAILEEALNQQDDFQGDMRFIVNILRNR